MVVNMFRTLRNIIYMQHKSCACYRIARCVNVQLYVGGSGSYTENRKLGQKADVRKTFKISYQLLLTSSPVP